MDQNLNPLGRRRKATANTDSESLDALDANNSIDEKLVAKKDPVQDRRVFPELSCPTANVTGTEPEGLSHTPESQPFVKTEPSFSAVHQETVTQRSAALRVSAGIGEPLPESEQPFIADEVASNSPPSRFADSTFGGLQSPWFRMLGWLGCCLLAIIIASSLLVAFSQTALLVREINSWILPARIAGWIALGVIWIAMAVAILQLSRILIRYRQSPGVSLSALEKIREREANRALAVHSEKSAAEKVRQFLNEYPTDESQAAFLKSVMGPTGQVSLFMEQKRLLSENHGISVQWLGDVRKRYASPLDDAARNIISRHSIAIGVGTAISPRGIVDVLVVVVALQRMTIDLCRLYGVRPSRIESLIILGHVIAAATLAAGGNEASNAVAEQVQETLTSSIGALGAGIVGNVGGRLAEGTVNAMFARRIGFRLQRCLSPIRD